LPRWLIVSALLSTIAAVVAMFGVRPVQGFDPMTHLTIGRWIGQGAAV
jgi:hypothetical protein